MALLRTGERKRLDIPHEPGEWIEIKRLSMREHGELDTATARTPLLFGLALMGAAISAWSYPEAVTQESVDRLDPVTSGWLIKAIGRHNSGELSDDEKKAGTSPSIAS